MNASTAHQRCSRFFSALLGRCAIALCHRAPAWRMAAHTWLAAQLSLADSLPHSELSPIGQPDVRRLNASLQALKASVVVGGRVAQQVASALLIERSGSIRGSTHRCRKQIPEEFAVQGPGSTANTLEPSSGRKKIGSWSRRRPAG